MGQIPDPLPVDPGVQSSFPNGDQCRLQPSAVAGFLFQRGTTHRVVGRPYLNGLLQRDGGAALPSIDCT